MPIGEARQRAEDLYRRLEGDSYRPLQWRQWDSFSAHTDRASADDLTVRTSDDGVDYICFNPGLVDKLFESSALTAEQLAARVAERHGLPGMTRGVDTNPPQPVQYWEFVSRRGWKVVIGEEKSLIYQDWRPRKNMR